jgi:hypothetical protein
MLRYSTENGREQPETWLPSPAFPWVFTVWQALPPLSNPLCLGVWFKVMREQVVCYADCHPRIRCLDREIHKSGETRENDSMPFVLFAPFRGFRGPSALRYQSMSR